MTIFKSSDKIKMYLNNSFGTSNLTQRVKITQGEIQAKRFRAVEARFYFAKKNPSVGFFSFYKTFAKYFPVQLPATFETCSGVPSATT